MVLGPLVKVSLLICITLAFLMPVAESPFYMGALVLRLSIVRAFILREATTWLALILFLIYVGGMLVTLAYLLALCPNQEVAFSPAILIPIILALFLLQDKNIQPIVKSWEVTDIYKTLNFSTLIILAVVLFLAIVRVVKIVSRSAGALRAFRAQ